MEFACGACNALDEYTFYMTPNQYWAMRGTTRGNIGVGLELTEKDNRVVVARVVPGSSAYLAGVKVEDSITRIGKKSTDGMKPDAARNLLDNGPVGSIVQVGISSDGMYVRTLPLKRQKVICRSVEAGWLPKETMSMSSDRSDIAYIQITRFRETTPQELDTALASLKEGGMKGLILDLRGNRGGSFEASVECARRFLASGLIVSTRKRDGKVTKYQIRSSDSLALPANIPLVVLIDGCTASAAEILAGALKDNGRARLIGQTTFGKGCIQRPFKLVSGEGKFKRLVGAIRLTIAKYFSPRGQSYNGTGIVPDDIVDRQPEADKDDQVEAAKNYLNSNPMPMNMAMKPSGS
jgi:carboxyl-terminal processing protease